MDFLNTVRLKVLVKSVHFGKFQFIVISFSNTASWKTAPIYTTLLTFQLSNTKLFNDVYENILLIILVKPIKFQLLKLISVKKDSEKVSVNGGRESLCIIWLTSHPLKFKEVFNTFLSGFIKS